MKRVAILALAASALFGCATSIDPETGRPYPCNRDAGAAENECPSGWHCGLEGICHNPDAGAAYPCRVDSDCELGWHCGAQGSCYDRTQVGAIACRNDAGVDDCAPGWRCGLNEICHSEDAGAAYQCVTDVDCELGWRCGPDGVCVDPSGDALRPNLYDGPLRHVALPRFLSQRPDLFAYGAQGPSFSDLFAAVWDGGLNVAAVWRYGYPLPDGGTLWADLERVPLRDAPVHGLTAYLDQVYVADNLGLLEYIWDFDGGTLQEVTLPFIPEQLRLLTSTPTPTVVAWSGNQVEFISRDGGLTPTALLIDGGVRIEDVAYWKPSLSTPFFVGATDQGLFALDADGGTVWMPVDVSDFQGNSVVLPNASCEGGQPDSGLRVVRFRPGSSASRLTLEAVEWAQDGGDPWRTILPLQVVGAPTLPWATECSDAGPRWEIDLAVQRTSSFCDACPPGEALVDFQTQGSVGWNARCRYVGPSGEAEHFVATSGLPFPNDAGSCVLPFGPCASGYWDPLLTDRTTPNFSSPDQFGFIGDHGQLWRSNGGLCPEPTTLPRPPPVLLRKGAQLEAFDVTTFQGYSTAYWMVPGMGMTAVNTLAPVLRIYPFAPVTGDPDLAIGSTGTTSVIAQYQPSDPPFGLSGLVATIPSGNANLRQGTASAVGPLPDGGVEILIASGDALLAGELPPTACLSPLASCPDGGLGEVDLKLVPSPELPILSVAGGSAPGGEFRGFVLTQNNVSEVKELSPIHWSSTLIDVPLGDWQGLWSDGARGRLVYGDGEVLSLPSRVWIGEALPPGAQLLDWGQFCGQLYAATSQGVYRLGLNPDGGSIGAWRHEDLSDALPDGGTFSSVGLHSEGDDLLVIDGSGLGVRLVPNAPCQ